MREKLSVLIPALNEEENIAACIESLRNLADELVLLDNYSTDRTVEIARSMSAVVHQREFDNYATNKNAGIDLLSNPWVLIIDADERLTTEAADEIRGILETETKEDAYAIRRDTYFCNRRVRCWSSGAVVRLFRKDKARYAPDRLVHEELQVNGTVGQLQHRIKHYTFRSFSQYLPKVHAFTTLAARESYARGIHATWLDFVLYPPSRFLKAYFLRMGLFDGVPGLLIAWLSAYSIYLKYAKLWELQRRNPADRQ